jgi:AraC family transcriptional regulator, transcriptional activator of the genes for pyochelin and ferripyochelin receptors
MTMLSSAPAASALRPDATDLVVSDRPIAGLSWSAYRSVLDALIGRATPAEAHHSGQPTNDTRAHGQRVVREYLTPEGGEGYWDYFQLSDELSVSITDATYRHDHWISVEGGRFFKVRVLLSGRLLGPNGELMLQGPQAQLHVCAGERGGGYAIAGGAATRLVVLHCAPELLTRLGFAAGEAPYPLQALTDREGAGGLAVKIHLTPELLRAAQWIDASRFTVLPAVRSVYLEALAMQLLCHTVTELSVHEPHEPIAGILPRDVKRICEARDFLAQHYASPPTIPQLARRVGMNQTKLKAGFKQIFHLTIYAYILQRRMEATAQMLVEREFSVAEIAYRVGYEYPANFSCAFKRYYGCSPRQWKRA